EHNQNASLRPVETMVRPVCQACHGIGYSLAALADRGLVERNFRGAPSAPAAANTMTMVRAKVAGRVPSAKEKGK
ncbi:MAG TPA: hypothetical protein VEL05_09890, partial [Candidatus Acidoferrum sp.]|nr:hypothetical protein [Candidatus Acidoferrum sp.]